MTKEPHTYGEFCAAPSEVVKLSDMRPPSWQRKLCLAILAILTLGWREH